MSFVERHGLWSSEQKEAAARLRRIVEEQKLEVIRLSFPGPARHPARQDAGRERSARPRWKAAAASPPRCSPRTPRTARCFRCSPPAAASACTEMEGAADVLMVPDPPSFRVLPWAPATGWLLCDLYFADGRPVPFATRHLYRGARRSCRARLRLRRRASKSSSISSSSKTPSMSPEDAGQPGQPPEVSLLSHGYQYLTEQRYDQMEPVLEIIRRDMHGARPAAALDRGRIRPEPVRIHVPADDGP